MAFRVLPEGMSGACKVWADGRIAIVLSSTMDRAERTATLAHELVHAQRGGGCADVLPGMRWDAVLAREELIVDRQVTDQLLDPVEFDAWIAGEVQADRSVDERTVSIEWAVPMWIARIGLEAALARARLRHVSARSMPPRCVTVTTPAGRSVRIQAKGPIDDGQLRLVDEMFDRLTA